MLNYKISGDRQISIAPNYSLRKYATSSEKVCYIARECRLHRRLLNDAEVGI